jgi:hypothetical protein
MLEDWKSTGGSEYYDPNVLEMGFSAQLSGSIGTCEGDGLYSITVDNVQMLVILSWIDRGVGCGEDSDYYDPDTGSTLRELSVTVRFAGVSEIEEVDNISPIILTTYIRLDAAGG